MQSDIKKTEAMLEIKKMMAKMAFKRQEKVDYSTWAFLKINKITESDAPITDGKAHKALSNKEHKDRIILENNGPLMLLREHDKHNVTKIASLIFTNQEQWRKIVYDHFRRMHPGHEIGYNTLQKISKIKEKLFSKDWIQAAVSFYDMINMDWLCNLMGLQQCNEINNEQVMQEFATYVFRPSIASAESIGVGVLQPSYAKDGYVQDFAKIYEEASDLSDLLDKYYYKYGHIPFCYSYSLYSMLDSFFAKHLYNDQRKWDSLWQWADNKESPLPRYHVCCYFIRNSNNVPENQLHKLYDELLNIIYIPIEESNELKWAAAWKLRCELAKHFGQFLESRLPGANTEKIYSQAWWMTEKIATIYGNRPEAIKIVREYTSSSEGKLSNLIWQTSRPRTQSSSLRYATLMTSSLWNVSTISQIGDKFLGYICNNNSLNTEQLMESILNSLIGCFPLKKADKTNSIYAYDMTCINAAEYLLENHPVAKGDQILLTLISVVKQLSDIGNLIDHINKLPEFNHRVQPIIAAAMRVMAYTDLIQDEDEIWESICNEDWIEKMFLTVNEAVVYSITDSLIEIILQKQDKWAWQLPHLFSIICQKHIDNEKIKNIAFICVVISSICSDTCSALKRTLLNNKADISELQKEWSNRLQNIYHIAPECTQSRLRPVILCLDS